MARLLALRAFWRMLLSIRPEDLREVDWSPFIPPKAYRRWLNLL